MISAQRTLIVCALLLAAAEDCKSGKILSTYAILCGTLTWLVLRLPGQNSFEQAGPGWQASVRGLHDEQAGDTIGYGDLSGLWNKGRKSEILSREIASAACFVTQVRGVIQS